MEHLEEGIPGDSQGCLKTSSRCTSGAGRFINSSMVRSGVKAKQEHIEDSIRYIMEANDLTTAFRLVGDVNSGWTAFLYSLFH
jgi:hypothetical protein